VPIPKTPCMATALHRNQPDQVIGEVQVISFDLGSNPNRVAPEITVKASQPHLFSRLNQQGLHLYVHDQSGNKLTFVECTIASGPDRIVFNAMDVLDETGKSIFTP
jgi:hypothetical protein